jgi:hypothetical protein
MFRDGMRRQDGVRDGHACVSMDERELVPRVQRKKKAAAA